MRSAHLENVELLDGGVWDHTNRTRLFCIRRT